MQNTEILQSTHFGNTATGIPLLALACSEEINIASSGVSLLCKVLIFCEVLILVTPLLEYLSLLWGTLRKSELPVAG